MILKDIRKELGLTQKAFGDKFHIGVQNIKNWEQGLNTPLEYVVYMIRTILEQEKTIQALKEKFGGSYISNPFFLNFTCIKDLRLATGLSQDKFSNKFCIPLTNIHNWEQGINKPYEYVFFMVQTILENEKIINELSNY